jgi:hypothetical protein
MGLLDGLEKLINEHGSAAILKERIALANDKYAILENKLEASALRVTELESENKTLRLNPGNAKAEIENLKGDTEKARGARLDDVKEKILVLLAGQESYEQNIARTLGVGNQVAAFHLQELESAGFIGRSLSMTGEEFPWYLNQEGRRYLVTHDLIA